MTITHATTRATAITAVLAIATVLSASCTSDTAPKQGATITLTANQAAALMTRLQQVSTADPDLAWLADSATVVVQGGSEARVVSITLDGAEHSYYAVGLQRAFLGATAFANAFSTFHLIAFNDPTNATAFVVLNGYASSTGSGVPTEVSGNFTSGAVFGHLIAVSGQTVTDWIAAEGTASFARGTSGDICASLPLPQGASCVKADLVASATITHAFPDGNPGNIRTASLASVTVPGILLTFAQ